MSKPREAPDEEVARGDPIPPMNITKVTYDKLSGIVTVYWDTFNEPDLSGCDAAVDFTTPEAAPTNILAIAGTGCPVVVGTTGWYAELPRVSKKPAKREVEMAAKLVDGLHKRFTPSSYKDQYRSAVEKLIARKAQGKEIEPPDEPDEEPSDDLMAALEASLG